MGTLTGLERAGFIAHSRLSVFERRIAGANECIKFSYALCRRPFVSFSMGKDSSVMLYLIALAVPTAEAMILTGGETRLYHPDFDSIFAWWQTQFPQLQIREINVDHVFADGWSEATFAEQRHSFGGAQQWTRFLHSAGDYDGVFVGLREGESAMRRWRLGQRTVDKRFAIRRYTENRHDAKSGTYRICPVANWTTQDIGAYMISREIPLLASYDDSFDARSTMRLSTPPIVRWGELAKLRAQNPGAYQQIVDRFPELAQYT